MRIRERGEIDWAGSRPRTRPSPRHAGGRRVEAIEVGYPTLEIRVLGWRTSWIVVFLAVSALVALSLRRQAGVEF